MNKKEKDIIVAEADDLFDLVNTLQTRTLFCSQFDSIYKIELITE